MNLRTVTFIFAIGLVIWSISNRTTIKVTDAPIDPNLIQRRVEDYGDNKKGNGQMAISHFANSARTKNHGMQENAFSNALNLQKKNLSAFKDIEEISLALIEVSNSKKFSRELRIDEFQGTLDMRDGNIESVDISLPNNINLSASYSSIEGNSFKYYIGNQKYSASIVRTDKNSGTFMVKLDGGPLNQTKLTFRSADIADIDLRDSIQLADSGISPHQDIPKSFTKEQKALRAKAKKNNYQQENIVEENGVSAEAIAEELEEYESEDQDENEVYEADLERETEQEAL